MHSPDPPQHTTLLIRWIALLLILIGLVWLSAHGLMWVRDILESYNTTETSNPLSPLTVILLALYAVLIAVPFMPGIELGVALLVMQGATIAPFVYMATVFGLFTAFVIGRAVPLDRLHQAFGWLGLKKACDLVDTIATLPLEDRLERQRDLLPKPLAKLTVDYRYVTLAVLLNIPGTFAIGGGGGILLVAGLSRAFSTWGVLLTLLLATLPIPLAVWIMGTAIL